MSDDLTDPPPPAQSEPVVGPGPAAPARAAPDEGNDPEPAAAPIVPPASPAGMSRPGDDAGHLRAGAPDDDADPVLVSDGMKSDGTTTFAREGAERDTAVLLRGRSEAVSDDWQDYLIDAVPLPSEIAVGDAGVFESCLAVLQQRRLLLICHAPTPSAEARATAALRTAVSELLRREPRCRPLSSKYDRPFAPQNLAHTPQWRPDRRRSVIYLFRSDSADSIGFFNRQIEPVRHLCRTLRDNDGYLLLTVAVADAASLCEENLLSKEIALWRLRDAPSPPTEAPVLLGDSFDATLVACAALFPGLGFREFGGLIDSLVSLPEIRADAKPETRSRAERWHAGERDAVRAELHVVLRAPHTLDDVATADAGAEPGMYLDTRNRRVDTPDWLYERYASVLDHMAEVLAERYFIGTPTVRFGAAYRRLLLRLDMLGIRRLDEAWILRQLYAALREGRVAHAVLRLDGLLKEAVASGHTQQFATRCLADVASLLATSEADLVEALRANEVLDELAGQRRVPYGPTFWKLVSDLPQGEASLASIVQSQGSVVDLLLGQLFLDPATAMLALAGHMDDCGAAHLEWLSEANLRRSSQVPFPFARSVLRGTLARFLEASPARWLDYVDALVTQCNCADRGAHAVRSGRRLARDFVSALAMNCDGLVFSPSPTDLYRSLLGEGPARCRFVDSLAGLFAVTSPAAGDGTRETASVDVPAALLIYQSLARSLLRHHIGADEPVLDAIATLSRAWVRTLRREQQVRTVQVARDQLQKLQKVRAGLFGDMSRLRQIDESVRALQLLMRSWQQPARPAGSGAAATDSPVQRRPFP